MNRMVTVPLWLALAAGAALIWFVLTLLLLPGARWFLRRRINRLTAALNQRLPLKIPPIAMTRREVLIDRLVYDPKVLREVSAHAAASGIPIAVALRQVRHYAREIVPAFNAYPDFLPGNRLSRAVLKLLNPLLPGHAANPAH